MNDHGMIVVSLPAFERIAEDGHLAGLSLLNDQQAGQESELAEESHLTFRLLEAVDASLVGTYQQPAVANRQTIALALDLCRP